MLIDVLLALALLRLLLLLLLLLLLVVACTPEGLWVLYLPPLGSGFCSCLGRRKRS